MDANGSVTEERCMKQNCENVPILRGFGSDGRKTKGAAARDPNSLALGFQLLME